MTQARPTTYKGIQMRSRLEALFAQELDEVPGKGQTGWEYEPQCFASEAGQYLPDFRINYEAGPVRYIEVKPPSADAAAALKLMHIILASDPDAMLMVAVSDGGYPAPEWDLEWECTPRSPCSGCHRVTDRPLLRTNPQGDLLCGWCRRPGPKLIKDGVYLHGWAGDPDGDPVRGMTGLHCDGCDESFFVYISHAFPGETNLGVTGAKRTNR